VCHDTKAIIQNLVTQFNTIPDIELILKLHKARGEITAYIIKALGGVGVGGKQQQQVAL
jgi:hypothetical protein